MSQRSEVYRELRDRIKPLGELAGIQSTNGLLKGLDLLWRTLLRVRLIMIKTLIHQGKIESIKDVSAEDFYSLYLQIHNPKRERRLCEHCCGLVEFGITQCPYCGEKVNGQNTKEFLSSISIDIQAKPKSPDWNIDYSSKEMLEKARLKEEFDNTPKLVALTPEKYDQLPGPTGAHLTTGEARTRTRKLKLSRSAILILRWARRRELCNAIPLSISQLKELSQGDLILFVQTFQKKTKLSTREIFSSSMNELIRLALGYQGTTPIDVGPPPVGQIPEIDDGSTDGD